MHSLVGNEGYGGALDYNVRIISDPSDGDLAEPSRDLMVCGPCLVNW